MKRKMSRAKAPPRFNTTPSHDAAKADSFDGMGEPVAARAAQHERTPRHPPTKRRKEEGSRALSYF